MLHSPVKPGSETRPCVMREEDIRQVRRHADSGRTMVVLSKFNALSPTLEHLFAACRFDNKDCLQVLPVSHRIIHEELLYSVRTNLLFVCVSRVSVSKTLKPVAGGQIDCVPKDASVNVDLLLDICKVFLCVSIKLHGEFAIEAILEHVIHEMVYVRPHGVPFEISGRICLLIVRDVGISLDHRIRVAELKLPVLELNRSCPLWINARKNSVVSRNGIVFDVGDRKGQRQKEKNGKRLHFVLPN
eukprot:XP_001709219.1 Hypothetical protein GL50803_32206 [Giardia lamblia ATCC 50803]